MKPPTTDFEWMLYAIEVMQRFLRTQFPDEMISGVVSLKILYRWTENVDNLPFDDRQINFLMRTESWYQLRILEKQNV